MTIGEGDSTIRGALYARVSTEEQVEGYSIDAQRQAFRSLVETRDWTQYKEYIEEGKSAHTDDLRKRPVFREAMDDALTGKYDILVVHKIDSHYGGDACFIHNLIPIAKLLI